MDPFHQRLARVALEAAAGYGFCLAGGYAVQAHGFVDRVSKDVDLFTTMAATSDFPAAQNAVVAALRADGLEVAIEREGTSFARLAVTDPGPGTVSTVELGMDWRAYPPVQLAIGPVLHPADAVANKLCALFGRAEVRDYIDVHGVLEDGRFTTSELLRMAAEHDPGFNLPIFAEALRAVRRFPTSAFEPYKLTADQVDALHARLLAWADEVEAAGQ
ncbi:nucleotidyl transferase AbiEii/AbiGii toxin family protein [Natronosporangium hydrolyticum]|uniref:Nucleotidyl transferase AbiEii/AbiGii toxin family protein n=1 Tax=Natronosporangium hydrolyticum TaxID=2811111 RepID=A0A895Y573_9ACTN|nr:nucleotidyl transferase AbiEii/AbiGii toxin family protein [Natronosporangium hydrolyticum]QSB12561.1 nucleotidyl transferase AbiEii/AbiGii toxin family protein [Natronosporangium hydrolyticum]